MAVHALAASAFALLDKRGSLRFVTDVVHEDDALCLALACRALRDALWARFPAQPAGHAHAGKRLWTRDAMLAKLASRVTTAGVLVITNSEFYNPDTGKYYCGWPLSLPEGIGRLAYLPYPGLRKLHLHNISGVATLPESFVRLGSLEELIIEDCAGLLMEQAINTQGGLQALLAYMRGETIEGLQVLDIQVPCRCLAGARHAGARPAGARRGCGQVRLGAPPEGIGRLLNLTTLNIALHSIGADGATALAELPRLTSLNVNGNSIGAQGALALANLPRLTTLDVEDNTIGLQGAEALTKLSSLTTLNVGNNAIGAEGAAALAKLPSLATLNVMGNSIGVKGAAALAELPSLTTLDVGHNAIGAGGAAALTKLPSLTTLNATGNSIGDKGAAALAKLPNLTTLDVVSNSIGVQGAVALAELSSLTTLDISSKHNKAPRCGDNDIKKQGAMAVAKLPNLITMDGYTRTKKGNFKHLKCVCWRGPARRGHAAFHTCTFH